MTITAVDSEKFTLPLAVHDSYALATLETEQGEKFTITLGLAEDATSQLQKRSCDESDVDLMRFTSDKQRFCDGDYTQWFLKERYPFALLTASNELAGFVWFGPKNIPISYTAQKPSYDWDTFAIRMYTPYRGKRLAQPFAAYCISYYRTLLPEHALWLDVHAENVGAQKLYAKLGFIEIGRDEAGGVVMVME